MEMRPEVLDEYETVAYAWNKRANLSRYGDGELRLSVGGTSVSQRLTGPTLQLEMARGLMEGAPNCLVCLPRLDEKSPKFANWTRYWSGKYNGLYGQRIYGSSLITRPDSAPWIDTARYWELVTNFWTGSDVVLVRGEDAQHGITPEQISAARRVHLITGPTMNAYGRVDQLEEQIAAVWTEHVLPQKLKHRGPVIMSLGACATVLALRLARRGVWALDLGHIGKYMPSEFLFKPRVELVG